MARICCLDVNQVRMEAEAGLPDIAKTVLARALQVFHITPIFKQIHNSGVYVQDPQSAPSEIYAD